MRGHDGDLNTRSIQRGGSNAPTVRDARRVHRPALCRQPARGGARGARARGQRHAGDRPASSVIPRRSLCSRQPIRGIARGCAFSPRRASCRSPAIPPWGPRCCSRCRTSPPSGMIWRQNGCRVSSGGCPAPPGQPDSRTTLRWLRPRGRGLHESENQPHAKGIAAERLAVSGFLLGLSWRAPTLTSLGAARWLLRYRRPGSSTATTSRSNFAGRRTSSIGCRRSRRTWRSGRWS